MASFVKPEFPPLLGPGFHVMTVSEVRSLCVTRFRGSITRRGIMKGLHEVIRKLSAGGIVGEVWADGSFVTEKIDPGDVDILVRVSSDQYDNDPAKRAIIDWASHEDLKDSHSCDAYKWIEYSQGHPLFGQSEDERLDWTDFYGHSRSHVPKGIIVVAIPAVIS